MSEPIAEEEPQIATAEDLLGYAPEVPTEVVRIGKFSVKVRGILDPTVLNDVQSLARKRKALPTVRTGEKGEGPELAVSPEEIEMYTWLERGLVEPPLKYWQIVAVSKHTGLACMKAANKVVELSGLGAEAVDDAKNGSRGETTTDPANASTPGSSALSPPAPVSESTP